MLCKKLLSLFFEFTDAFGFDIAYINVTIYDVSLSVVEFASINLTSSKIVSLEEIFGHIPPKVNGTLWITVIAFDVVNNKAEYDIEFKYDPLGPSCWFTYGEGRDFAPSRPIAAEALAKHPKTFDKLYVNMVRAGEAGGVLDVVLSRLADFMEKSEAIKRKIKSAMIYPIVVLIAAIGILSFLLVKVIPKFAEIFGYSVDECLDDRSRQ